MLTFRAQFPLKHEKTVDDFLDACKKWIAGSPYLQLKSHVESLDLGRDDVSAQCEKENARFLRYRRDFEMVGMRHEKYDEIDGRRWVLEAVARRQSEMFWASVQLNVDCEVAVESLEQGKRPYLMKILLEDLGGGTDGVFDVCGHPHGLGEDQVGLAAALIHAQCDLNLPVVYVSRAMGEEVAVDADQLARWVSGMAHVVLEPSRDFSFRLRRLVEDANAYGGAIGIYWPDGADRFILLPADRYGDAQALQLAIASKVRVSLLSQRFRFDASWASLLDLKAADAIARLKEEGSKSINDFIAAFDQELEAKDQKLRELEQENQRLRFAVNQSLRPMAVSTRGIALESGENDLYQGERLGIVVDALKRELDACEVRSRRHVVIQDLLACNPVGEESERDVLLRELKEVLQGYTSMTAAIRSVLERMGFVIDHHGKHYKLTFRGDDRYCFVLPKSGSDHRGGLNSVAEARRRLF